MHEVKEIPVGNQIPDVQTMEPAPNSKPIESVYNPSGETLPIMPLDGMPFDSLKPLLNLSFEHLNFPPEMVFAGILSAISASLGNAVKFQTTMKDFQAKPTLWLCIVAGRGSRKSPIMSKTLKPLKNLSTDAAREHKERLASWETTDKKTPQPEFYSAVLNDATFEGLMKALEKNPHGVLSLQDELAGMMGNFGRYSGGSDMEGYCSLWNGDQTNITRKRLGAGLQIEDPFFTLIGGLQPTRLTEAFGLTMIESGFMDRVQFIYPNQPGERYVYQLAVEPPEVGQAWAKYYEGVNSLIRQATYDEWKPIEAESTDLWMKFYNAFGNLQNLNPENHPIQGLATKAQTMFGRISAVVHGMSVAFNGKPRNEKLTGVEVVFAYRLTCYFLEAALYTYTKLKQASPVDTLTEAERTLYESLPEDFPVSRADAMALNAKSKNPIAERTLDRFLKNDQYFLRLKWGEYQRKH